MRLHGAHHMRNRISLYTVITKYDSITVIKNKINTKIINNYS